MPRPKALYPRDHIDRLYMSRKEEGRGLVSAEDNVDASMQRLKNYIKKSKVSSTTAANCSRRDIITDRKATKTRKQKWNEKQLYGYFKQQSDKIAHETTWTWLKNGNLKRKTESLLIAAVAM